MKIQVVVDDKFYSVEGTLTVVKGVLSVVGVVEEEHPYSPLLVRTPEPNRHFTLHTGEGALIKQ